VDFMAMTISLWGETTDSLYPPEVAVYCP
jgi:hypothetical protein